MTEPAPYSPAPTGEPAYTLELRQRLTMMINRWDVVVTYPGGAEQNLAFVEQKRFSLKERITFFSDDSKSQVALSIGARNVMEIAGTYDVLDHVGQPLGVLKKNFGQSLLRSTYELDYAGGRLVGQERSQFRAIARRIVNLVTDVPWLFPIQFDFTAGNGAKLVTIDRKVMRLRDLYYVRVYDNQLDWRLAAALAVACDAFMNR